MCDSLDEARRLAFESHGERFKVVTTDGTLINKAGLMTGGSSPAERARASRWNDKEYSTLKAQADQLERELVLLGSAPGRRAAARCASYPHPPPPRAPPLPTLPPSPSLLLSRAPPASQRMGLRRLPLRSARSEDATEAARARRCSE